MMLKILPYRKRLRKWMTNRSFKKRQWHHPHMNSEYSSIHRGLVRESWLTKTLLHNEHYEVLVKYWTSLVAQMVKGLSTMWETWVQSLGWEDPLEKEMAIHSRAIAWKIPWTEEPGRLQPMGSQRVEHDWATSLLLSIAYCVHLLCVKLNKRYWTQDI